MSVSQASATADAENAVWEHFPHVADLGIRGYGPTAEAAFANAAVALTAVVTDPLKVVASESVVVVCGARDLETLFNDWLNALIYEMGTRRMLFSRFEVDIMTTDAGYRLNATASGEAVDRLRHQPAVEIKGATYTELKVAPLAADRWLAQCVVDV